jgi:hypothetical protein
MTDSRRLGWWALWTVVTAIGYSLGLYAGFFLAYMLLAPIIAVITIGVGVGFLQRLVVQRLLEPHRSRMWSPADSAGWILGSVFGMTLVFAVGWLVVEVGHVDVDRLGVLWLIGAFTIAGALTGLVQERVLRRYVLQSRWWIAVSALGWGASALGLGFLTTLADAVYDVFAILMAPAIAGVVLGVITGGVLVRLPTRPRPLIPS